MLFGSCPGSLRCSLAPVLDLGGGLWLLSWMSAMLFGCCLESLRWWLLSWITIMLFGGRPGSLRCSLAVVLVLCGPLWLLSLIFAVFLDCSPGCLQCSLAVVLDLCDALWLPHFLGSIFNVFILMSLVSASNLEFNGESCMFFFGSLGVSFCTGVLKGECGPSDALMQVCSVFAFCWILG